MNDAKTTADLPALLAEEAAIRTLARDDAGAAAVRAGAALEPARALFAASPDDPRAAALLLRLMRRAVSPPDELLPLIEAIDVRFPDEPEVRSAVSWIRLVEAQFALLDDDPRLAVELVGGCFASLAVHRDPSYMALSLLGGAGGLATDLLDDRRAHPADRAVALDELNEILEKHAAAWLDALPEKSPDGEDAEGRPGPRARALLLLRRSGRAGERWTLLLHAADQARRLGVENEWILDSEAEALAATGDAEGALQAVRAARRRFPRSDHLARREGALLGDLDRADESLDVLFEAAVSATSPWPWRDFAQRLGEAERLPSAWPIAPSGWESHEASRARAEALKAALHFQDPTAPGTVWKLHFELGRQLHAFGDEPGAAEELFLAREARLASGWSVGRDLKEYLAYAEQFLADRIAELEEEPPGAVRKAAREGYRRAREGIFRRVAREGVVVALRPAFGFLRIDEDGSEVFFARSILGKEAVSPGDRLRAVVVRSYDERKRRESRRAVWLERADRER